MRALPGGKAAIQAVADLNLWAANAAPGARRVYARGFSIAETPEVIAARVLFDEGEVDLVQVRAVMGFDYCVVRRAAVCPRNRFGFGRSVLPAEKERRPRKRAWGPAMDEDDVAVLALLNAAAATGKPCPTNAALARALGLKGPDAISYRLRKLTNAGAIVVEMVGHARRRIVIVRTGLATGVSA